LAGDGRCALIAAGLAPCWTARRGAPPADLASLARRLSHFLRLAANLGDLIAEMDVTRMPAPKVAHWTRYRSQELNLDLAEQEDGHPSAAPAPSRRQISSARNRLRRAPVQEKTLARSARGDPLPGQRRAPQQTGWRPTATAAAAVFDARRAARRPAGLDRWCARPRTREARHEVQRRIHAAFTPAGRPAMGSPRRMGSDPSYVKTTRSGSKGSG